MAYGSVTWTETTVASSTGYSIIVKHGYSQNPNTNKSYRYVAWMKVSSIKSGYSMYNQTGGAQAGIQTRDSVFGPESWKFTISSLGYATYDPGDAKSSEFSHNADGSATNPPGVGWYFNHGISSVSGFPSYTMTSWQYFTPTMPTLSRSRPVCNATITDITGTTCKINFSGTCSSYNSLSQYCYRIDSGSDVYTTSTSVTVTGLTPSTSYTMHTWVKDNWEWWSPDKTISITTKGMPYIRVSGAWKKGTAAYIKVSGSWEKATAVYIKVNGAWKIAG
jgi:hypothetical protein